MTPTKKHKAEMDTICGLLDRVSSEVEYYLCEIDDLYARLQQGEAAVKARDIKIMKMDRELDDEALKVKALDKLVPDEKMLVRLVKACDGIENEKRALVWWTNDVLRYWEGK